MYPDFRFPCIKIPTFRILLLSFAALLFIGCKNQDSDPEPVIQTIKLSEVHNLAMLDNEDFIVDFQFDQSGTLWVVAFWSGLYRLSGDEITSFNTSNSPLPDNRINDIFIDYLNRLWIATNNGFAKYDHETWEVYTIENTPLAIPRISQISVNKQEEILLGNGDVLNGGLLFRNQEGIWKSFTAGNSNLPCNVIYEIELTESDDFWISTAQFQGVGGVVKFENETIGQVLNVENSGLLYNHIDNIEIDEENIWIGYWAAIFNEFGVPEGGIQRVNPESNNIMSFFPNETELVSNRITAMKLHSDNSLWFATVVDDPGCENCFSGIGVIPASGNIVAVSALNSDIASNIYYTKLNEDNLGNMYVASEHSLYLLELK